MPTLELHAETTRRHRSSRASARRADPGAQIVSLEGEPHLSADEPAWHRLSRDPPVHRQRRRHGHGGPTSSPRAEVLRLVADGLDNDESPHTCT